MTCSRWRAIDSDQLLTQMSYDLEFVIDPSSLLDEIRIVRADDDPVMQMVALMQPHMFPVECQDGAFEGGREFQNFLVLNCLVRFMCFERCDHVMIQFRKLLDDGQGKVFIGV